MTHGGRRLSFDGNFLKTLAVAATLIATALASPVRADETFGLSAPARDKESKPLPVSPSARLRVDVGGSPLVVLEPMDNRTLLLQDEINENRMKILRIGVAREVTVRAEDGAWTQLADGSRLWTAEVVSPNAIALRLHFADLALPAGAELAVYGVEGASFAAPAAGAPEIIRGGKPLASHWSGTVTGERARIEYLAPAGNEPASLPFRVDLLQHIYRDPIAEESSLQEKAAGPCHNDVTCYPEWADVAASVARYSIIFPGGIGLCTGQLINNLTQDFTPYFLTANHCLSDGSEAAGTEFFWLYQTSSCGGAPPSLGSVPRSQGATLISTNSASDYTLLQVEGALPDGLFWSGWTSIKPGVGVDAAAIHHPQGDYKRISFGFRDSDAPLCGANHVTISWTDAPTEPGSSGGGIFRDDTQQLFGQLHGGPSACGNESFDCYGAFSTTYGKVKKFLQKGGSDDNSDPNDSCSKPRTVGKAGTLSNRIVKVNDTDWYRFSVPAGKTVTIHLDFANGNGDIDLAAFAACGGDPIAVSRSTGDSEEVAVTNVGTKPAFLIWQVYLYSDTRNNYDQRVTVQ